MTRLAIAVLVCAPAFAQVGQFDTQTDIGSPARAGSASFDKAKNEYTITGGGANMWATADAFHYVYTRLTGDVRVTGEIRFIGESAQPHRKAGFVIRQSLEPGSPYADAVVHGDGLTSLQYRMEEGAETLESRSAVNGPVVLQLERRGGVFTLRAGKPGELHAAEPVTLELKDPVYLGLAVCAHDPEASETAVFSNIRIDRPAK